MACECRSWLIKFVQGNIACSCRFASVPLSVGHSSPKEISRNTNDVQRHKDICAKQDALWASMPDEFCQMSDSDRWEKTSHIVVISCSADQGIDGYRDTYMSPCARDPTSARVRSPFPTMASATPDLASA
jgi:hypothetical protein